MAQTNLRTPEGMPVTIKWKEVINDLPDIEFDEEWASHLKMVLTESFGSRSMKEARTAAPAVPQYELTPESPVINSRLWLVEVSNVRRPYVIGEGAPDLAQVQLWRQAILAAGERVSKTDKEFTWQAVIGTSRPSADALASPMRVGPLQLRPGGVCFRESFEPTIPNFGPRAAYGSSWPIIVEGHSRGHRFKDALADASRLLHRICALLSLGWGGHVILKQAPLERGTPVHIPARAAWDTSVPDLEPCEPGAGRDLPCWIEDAWTRLDTNEKLAKSVAVFQEGLALYERHPSFALVAFVGAVEGVAPTIQASAPCKECRQTKGQAGARFRQTLATVLSPGEVSSLSDAVYGRRSATAHAGKLHGTEALFRLLIGPDMLKPAPETDFAWLVLHPLRSAAQRVLVKALGGP